MRNAIDRLPAFLYLVDYLTKHKRLSRACRELSAYSPRTGFIRVENPADHVGLMRPGLFQSGFLIIIAYPITPTTIPSTNPPEEIQNPMIEQRMINSADTIDLIRYLLNKKTDSGHMLWMTSLGGDSMCLKSACILCIQSQQSIAYTILISLSSAFSATRT